MSIELCERCGARLYDPAASHRRANARLCPRHLEEARRASPPFACSFEEDDPLAAHLERELAERSDETGKVVPIR
jgi:hypothetical protein